MFDLFEDSLSIFFRRPDMAMVSFGICLFLIGVWGILVIRNTFLVVLMALELMLFGIAFAFLNLGYALDEGTSIVATLLLLSLGAVETAFGLGIIFVFYWLRGPLIFIDVSQSFENGDWVKNIMIIQNFLCGYNLFIFLDLYYTLLYAEFWWDILLFEVYTVYYAEIGLEIAIEYIIIIIIYIINSGIF